MNRQRGAALLIALLILVLAVTAALLTTFNQRNSQSERDKITEAALAKAKDALIAWSVTRGQLAGNERPGELPCPDFSAPGSLTYGTAAGTCSAGRPGRLPWKELGIAEPLDGSGEPLWYAVDGAFRVRWGTGASTNRAINSDSKASLVIYGSDENTLLNVTGGEYAAILFSPGAPLPGQDRTASTTASAYLDSGALRNNATSGGPFVHGPVKGSGGNIVVNDRLLGITATELVSAVEKRILRESRNLLGAFAVANGGKYPNAAPASCILTPEPLTPNLCNQDTSKCFGRLPEDALDSLPSTPDWFIANGWGRVIIYAVNKNAAANGTPLECSPTLALDGNIKSYILLSPGTRLGTIVRPSANVADYLETAGNLEVWSSGSINQNKLFSPTPLSPASNDQALSEP